MKFNKAVDIIFRHEGYYSKDSKDPGGETKYGISKRSYPDLDIKNLTKKHAKFIYENDYWTTCKCLGLPESLRLAVFDCAVNQGVRFASVSLQRACGAVVDGIIGPMTLEQVSFGDDDFILKRFMIYRLDRYVNNKNFDLYGRGWMKRLIEVALETK